MTTADGRGGLSPVARLSDLAARAGVGAGVTVLVSVLPVVGLVAPAVGAGVASWTDDAERPRGPKIGAATGALVALLSLPLTFFAVWVAAAVSPAATVGVLALTLFGAAYVVGSGALGGYLADRIAEDRDTSPADADREAPATPIERLKHRYVEGDISDAEFERRLDRLVSADRDRTDSTSRRETPETTAPEHER
ncbi:SHOCT domain-containing protein [Halorubrum ezzemoulense]|uniref:SHOCT domain-containing protein n=1 Tax=Halorubrum ezzemoulense TaxID=337243 RepID=A0A256IZE2_HALEZ|nr:MULTISPECIES: SHOCT domain-containing protein [Halorubrum]MDB9248866.1 SHOCT domain-containing protein [Halorubrum ezzemoulense]MDB9258796.1 SHOCT domain-containing protein [Halorubrum ezzemoulense]MDB9262625.1 SHOCT domain-containing protein [Halorubrum ezzemoulense]MDB9265815.1 SHOCT domain-containing protein [Halorubrum ezzemoulense]MDB9269157.1 SHOCT domain-containing protein [Halorubrum ezzemoulense]